MLLYTNTLDNLQVTFLMKMEEKVQNSLKYTGYEIFNISKWIYIDVGIHFIIVSDPDHFGFVSFWPAGSGSGQQKSWKYPQK